MKRKEKTKKVWDGYVNKKCPKCNVNNFEEIPIINKDVQAQGEKLRCKNCGHESELMLL